MIEKIKSVIQQRVLIIVCIFGMVIIAGINVGIIIYTHPSIVNAEDATEKLTAVLVLGAAVRQGGKLSHVLEDRALIALDLYQKGFAKKILASGDHGNKRYDEVNAMKKFFLSRGVRPEDLFLDHAGFDTYSSIVRARDVFLVRDMYIVTQRFHIHRALFIAKQCGIKTLGVYADRRTYVFQAWYHFRELFARVKAITNVVMGRSPKYRGKIIPITHDGRASWD